MLFNLRSFGRICFLSSSVDFRKGVSGLSYILHELDYDRPKIGDVYIFHNDNRKSLKILYYGDYGFELWYKKSSIGRYSFPNNLLKDHYLSKGDFKRLLQGYSILESGFAPIISLKTC